MEQLPAVINGGAWQGGHVQGIAVDTEKGFVYYSFTTVLVKTDLTGHVIGTVKGLVGHLGCIDLNREDGKVYGSLEFKNDTIGMGIFKSLGREGAPAENAFYISIFDVDKIDRMDMDAEQDGIMTTVYLPEVVAWYEGKGRNDLPHHYACSGIDGTSFGPYFGEAANAPTMLMIACGIYGDVTREDNDHQVILCYDWRKFAAVAEPLSQNAPHHSGISPKKICFFYTGNTEWGVQNLCYDPYTRYWLFCVYKGKKTPFPNYTMYLADGTVAPISAKLQGLGEESGLTLTPAPVGVLHEESGIRGFRFRWGSTGVHALGDGRFYFSHDGKTEDKRNTCVLHLYRYTGKGEDGFEKIQDI